MKSQSRALLTFGLVGIFGTVCHYATLITLVELLAAAPVVATTAGFLVGMIVNYLLNYHYTFRSKHAHVLAAPKFFAIAIATGLLNGLLVYTGVEVARRNYLAVQIVTTLVLFMVNFLLNSAWTFRSSLRS